MIKPKVDDGDGQKTLYKTTNGYNMEYLDTSIGRRSFLSGAVATIAGASVIGASDPLRAEPSPVDGEHWTQPGGNAASTAATRNGVGPTGDVSIAWDGGVSGYYGDVTVGAVVDGTVYTSGSNLAAFDATDGTELWSYEADVPDKDYPEMGVSGDIEVPTVMDGTVFAPVRFGVYDADNSFHAALIAVDAETGTKQWRIDAPVSHAQFSSVTAADGSLFVSGPDLDGGEGRFVYALDAADGTVRWRHPRQRGTSDPLVVADGLVFVAPPNGVKAYDAASGELVWEALPRVKDLIVAMVSDGTLFVSESINPGATIIALEATSGNQQWKTAYGGDVGVGVFTVDAEQLYISTSENEADVIALDRTDGSENWRTIVPQPPEDDIPRKRVPTFGMARIGELLYVGGAGLEPSDGSIVWTQEFEYSAMDSYSLDAVAGGQLYFSNGNMGGGLVVLEEA